MSKNDLFSDGKDFWRTREKLCFLEKSHRDIIELLMIGGEYMSDLVSIGKKITKAREARGKKAE